MINTAAVGEHVGLVFRAFEKINITWRRREGSSDFTLIELLVVIAIMAILVSMIFPSLRLALHNAYLVKCMAQEKQLTLAWDTYAEDFDGEMVGADDQINGPLHNAWIDDNQWSPDRNTPPAIKRGALFPYVNSVEVYRCPNDEKKQDTYRPSNHLGYPAKVDWQGPEGINIYLHNTRQIHNPSGTMLFVEEDSWCPVGWDGWTLDPRQDSTISYNWIDDVGLYHLPGREGMNVSYSDGHVEFWVWEDSRTYARTPTKDPPNGNVAFQSHPGSLDIERVYYAWWGIQKK